MLNCELYIKVHTVAKGGRKLIISVCWMQGWVRLIWTLSLPLSLPLSLSQYTWDQAQCDKEKWSMQSPPN